MKSKLSFIIALIATALLHALVLGNYQVQRPIASVEPQKEISPIINIQMASIKAPEPEPEPEPIPEPEPVVEPIPEPIIEEVIVPEPIIIPKPIIKPPTVKPVKKVKKKKKIKKKVKKKKVKKKKKKKKKVKPSKAAKVSTKAKRSAPKMSKRTYMGKVRRLIERNKRYPRAAERMRQQGTVRIRFTISRNGRISGARVVGSSSHARLNKAALKILRKIGAFPPIPRGLGSSMTITVPVKYRIIN